MRRSAAIPAILIALALAPAAAAYGHGQGHGHGQARTHGPDGRAVDRGAQEPPARGGPRGRSARSRARTSRSSVRDYLPEQWCGAESADGESAHAVDNGAHRFQAFYTVPADAPSRLAELAGEIQAGAFGASGLLERHYGRAIRFAMGTSCGPQYLSIALLRLPQSSVELQALAATPEGTLSAVARALEAAGLPNAIADAAGRHPERNAVVWLDGPGPLGACGQGTFYDDGRRGPDNLNDGGGQIALVLRDGSGFCGSSTVRHEIGHNLGAVQAAAPHIADLGHCLDALEDTMCVPWAPTVAGGGYHSLFFDYGNDDYWDPPGGQPLPWWTANLSRFLCPDAACNATRGVADARPQRPRLSVRAARRKSGRWRILLRSRGGAGSARVTVRCRRAKRGRQRQVLNRRRAIPIRMTAFRRCHSRPRAKLTGWRQPRS